jgi:hypothetical protein
VRSNETNRELCALWIANPEAAYTITAKAILDADGDVRAAAQDLRIARWTLYRWIHENERLRVVVARARHRAKEHTKRTGRNPSEDRRLMR